MPLYDGHGDDYFVTVRKANLMTFLSCIILFVVHSESALTGSGPCRSHIFDIADIDDMVYITSTPNEINQTSKYIDPKTMASEGLCANTNKASLRFRFRYPLLLAGILIQDQLNSTNRVTRFNISYQDAFEQNVIYEDKINDPKIFQNDMFRNLIDLPSLIESDDIRVNILQWDGSPCLRLTFIGCFSGFYECPKQWSRFKTNCYKKLPSTMNWMTGRMHCSGIQSGLLEIAVNDELEFIKRSVSNESVWLGLSSRASGSPYSWLGSNATFNMSHNWHWASGHPALTNNSCVILTPNGTLANADCDAEQHGTVCTQPAKPCKTRVVPAENITENERICSIDGVYDFAIHKSYSETRNLIQSETIKFDQVAGLSFLADGNLVTLDEESQIKMASRTVNMSGLYAGLHRGIPAVFSSYHSRIWTLKDEVDCKGFREENQDVKTSISSSIETTWHRQRRTWCYKSAIKGSYIKIDMRSAVFVGGVAVHSINGSSYTHTFNIKYSDDGNTWADYNNEIKDFENENNVTQFLLVRPFYARYLQITFDALKCIKVRVISCPENLALGKIAYRSSTTSYQEINGTLTDGDVTSGLSVDSSGDGLKWIVIDLKTLYEVHEVVITTSGLPSFSFRISVSRVLSLEVDPQSLPGATICANVTAERERNILVVPCRSPVIGRYVVISSSNYSANHNSSGSINEVEVYTRNTSIPLPEWVSPWQSVDLQNQMKIILRTDLRRTFFYQVLMRVMTGINAGYTFPLEDIPGTSVLAASDRIIIVFTNDEAPEFCTGVEGWTGTYKDCVRHVQVRAQVWRNCYFPSPEITSPVWPIYLDTGSVELQYNHSLGALPSLVLLKIELMKNATSRALFTFGNLDGLFHISSSARTIRVWTTSEIKAKLKSYFPALNSWVPTFANMSLRISIRLFSASLNTNRVFVKEQPTDSKTKPEVILNAYHHPMTSLVHATVEQNDSSGERASYGIRFCRQGQRTVYAVDGQRVRLWWPEFNNSFSTESRNKSCPISAGAVLKIVIFRFGRYTPRAICRGQTLVSSSLKRGTTRCPETGLTVTCGAGHHVENMTNDVTQYDTTCSVDGTWSPPLKQCHRLVDCGVPQNNTSIQLKDPTGFTSTLHSILEFTCAAGHVGMTGDSSVTCGRDGRWSAFPMCSPLNCSLSWTSWSTCSEECGRGIQWRHQACNGTSQNQSGDSFRLKREAQFCLLRECPYERVKPIELQPHPFKESDGRASAIAVGSSALAFMLGYVIFILVLDSPSLARDLRHMKRNVRDFCRMLRAMINNRFYNQ